MNINECKEYAKEKGFNSISFCLIINGKTHICKWIDAWLGAFIIQGFRNCAFYASDIQSTEHNCKIIS
jgi:hypothetical protein